MKYKNIREVKKLYKEIDAYTCVIDLYDELNGNYDEAFYCARRNGGGICNHILTDIENGNFIGTIEEYNYPTEEDILNDYIEEIRMQRDLKLAETDWTQLPDIPESTKLKWQPYRQALRDITDQPGFPQNFSWPAPPQ